MLFATLSAHTEPSTKILDIEQKMTFATLSAHTESSTGRWSPEQAQAWQKKTGWLSGCNFLPSTAINQLEMFQKESFDPATIDRELRWAHSLGFNCARVYLQDLLWEQDSKGFLKRLDRFLAIADKNGIGIVFVLFDSCWDPFPKLGTQRQPRPGVHNSGWVQSPGADILRNPSRHPALKSYVLGVVGHFRDDRRIHAWDVWNEPDNMNRPAYVELEPQNKTDLVLPLLRQAFTWAREAKPSQPLTSAVWIGPWADPEKLNPTEQVQLGESDIISFHNYDGLSSLQNCVNNLRRYNRPLLCSEYMSRGNGSFFDPNLGYLKAQGVGGINWGLVDGKSQTIYPWDSWTKKYAGEPPLWFHDIFRKDGRAYRPEETAYIRSVTGSEPLSNGKDFSGWKAPHGEWITAGDVVQDAAKPEAFSISKGEGVMVNGAGGRAPSLVSTAEFGDMELHVEFCIPRHSNSGIYLLGQYEVQVYDSYGVPQDAYPGIECGGIYPRWVNEANIEGHSPRVNASKPPGSWQSFDITFQAARFNKKGVKTSNARIIRMLHNGQLIHENVELKGPTRGPLWNEERATGPILLQGDHGPVAYRNIRLRRIGK